MRRADRTLKLPLARPRNHRLRTAADRGSTSERRRAGRPDAAHRAGRPAPRRMAGRLASPRLLDNVSPMEIDELRWLKIEGLASVKDRVAPKAVVVALASVIGDTQAVGRPGHPGIARNRQRRGAAGLSPSAPSDTSTSHTEELFTIRAKSSSTGSSRQVIRPGLGHSPTSRDFGLGTSMLPTSRLITRPNPSPSPSPTLKSPFPDPTFRLNNARRRTAS